jgi:YVTN family beta-propeller protein
VASWPLDRLVAASHAPSDVAVVGERVYVAMRASDAVALVQDGAVSALVPVGRQPIALCAAPERNRVYAASTDDASITVIEGATPVALWTLSDAPTALAAIGEQVWVGTMADDLLMLSADSGILQGRVALGRQMPVMRIAGGEDGRAYALTYGWLDAIDPIAQRPVASVAVPNALSVAVSPGGSRVYVGGYDDALQASIVQVFDSALRSELGRTTVPQSPGNLQVSPDGATLYVLSQYQGLLTALDARSLGTLAQVAVGDSPRGLALDRAGARAYLATGSDSLYSLALVAPSSRELFGDVRVTPLALQVSAMVADPDTGVLYVACSSCDLVYVVQDGQVTGRWSVGRQPSALALLPGAVRLAVLCTGANRLDLLDTHTGVAVLQLGTGSSPQGLSVVPEERLLYAGDSVYTWDGELVDTVAIPTLYGTELPPVATARDTRRGQSYAVAYNGVPGSNGGYEVSPLDGSADGDAEVPQRMPGRLSVISVLYDAGSDRWYSTNSRMGTFGLQVAQAQDNQELLYLHLPQYPTNLALNPASGHLWLALLPADTSPEAQAQLLAYHTASMQRVASLGIPGVITALAVDPQRNRIYAASGDLGIVRVVQDVASRAPSAPALATLAPVPRATPAPTPTCFVADDPAFASLMEARATLALGCPYQPAERETWARQSFEQGELLWQASSRAIFVLTADGRYRTIGDAWREGQPERSCADGSAAAEQAAAAEPPAGVQAPKRGFGLVWCQEPGVRAALGWATSEEQSFDGLNQLFAGGLVLQEPDGSLLVLHSSGRWYAVQP